MTCGLRVLFPGRVVERHVGGNTTYARHLMRGLTSKGVETGIMPFGRHPVETLVRETLTGLTPSRGSILHYSADTGPLVKTRATSLVTVHGVASRWIDVARTPAQERTWRFRVQRAIVSTQHVITVSQSAAADITDVFDIDPANITTIPHGIDSAAFQRDTTLSVEVADKLPGEFALYLGNVEPRKNLTALVEAFGRSSLAKLGLPLVIAGKPAWNFSEIMAAITAAPNTIYLGFVSDEDRVALMQRCTIFVFPSLYEGFGLPVLEAMAAGAPVATSRRGSLAEVAGPAFEIADLDAEGIAASVSAALTNQEWLTAAPATGRDWAAGFQWDESIEAHLAVYRNLATR